jgi:two-component system sensor histidine kinase PilS (NtrC family)
MLDKLPSWLRDSRPLEASTTIASSLSAGITVLNPDQASAPRQAQVFIRLWLGFLVGRVLMAVFFAAVMWATWSARAAFAPSFLVGSMAYLILTVVQRWQVGTARQVQFSQRLVGLCAVVDLFVIVVLHHSEFRVANYYPLLALPLLYVSILGTRIQALALASAVTLLLLGEVWFIEYEDLSAQFLQAAGKGLGGMISAYLINLLSVRLDEANLQVQTSQAAAELQIRINESVMSEMAHGVVVADEKGRVQFANPYAKSLLGLESRSTDISSLLSHAGHEAFRQFIEQSFVEQAPQHAQIGIRRISDGGSSLLEVSSRLIRTEAVAGRDVHLCMVFMEDSARVEERVQQERLAIMGRMSAAVAHEIRNPLAAIVQAGDLMREELTDSRLQRILGIVSQNAQRIGHTVDNVLDAATGNAHAGRAAVVLEDLVRQTCDEWMRIHASPVDLHVSPLMGGRRVRFDAEQLRRALVNLLDNAKRHGKSADGLTGIHVELSTQELAGGSLAVLSVFNPGPQLEAVVQERMFEPFYSSQSRSSGLGLYISRQLCAVHRAQLTYSYASMKGSGSDIPVRGHLFSIVLRWAHEGSPPATGGGV